MKNRTDSSEDSVTAGYVNIQFRHWVASRRNSALPKLADIRNGCNSYGL